jgi:hypothetical protein
MVEKIDRVLRKVKQAIRNEKVHATDYRLGLSFTSSEHWLATLADKYHSDKGTNLPTDKKFPWQCHSYTEVYDFMFGLSRLSIKSIFECGIGTTDTAIEANMSVAGKPGASLRMWKEYFPMATVYGADIDTSVLFSEDRIFTSYVDQLSRDSIAMMWCNFTIDQVDIIIDDGLHKYEAGVCLFEESISHLHQNGTYIIEDVCKSDLSRYKKYFSAIPNVHATFIERADHEYERDYNAMIVIRHLNDSFKVSAYP